MAAVELAVEDERWLELVRDDPEALPFHHPAWSLLLSEAYGFRPFVLGVADSAGRLTAGIPCAEIGGRVRGRRWVALPFSDICPPLVPESERDALARAVDAARQRVGIASVEIRGRVAGGVPGQKSGYVHVLPLTADPAEVASRFRASVRRNIRTAERGGATVRLGSTESDVIDGFYRLHVDNRRRLGLPVQPIRFFRLLWRRLLAPGLGRLILVDIEGTVASAAVFLHWNQTVVYKYGASDPRFWPERPNNLLFSEAIKWACESGYSFLNFGRTDHGSTSLRRFKLGWGAVEHSLEYSFLGAGANGRRGDPPQIVRTAIRRSPRWVTRALGELLYRGAA